MTTPSEAPVARALTILSEIAAERQHQVEDLGFDLDHDRRIGQAGFGWLLARRAIDLVAPAPIEVDVRRLLVEICAIAVGAIEMVDAEPDTEGALDQEWE